MVYPQNLGEIVEVTLTDGSIVLAYWDGVQWWTGVDDILNNLSIDNILVVSWQNRADTSSKL